MTHGAGLQLSLGAQGVAELGRMLAMVPSYP